MSKEHPKNFSCIRVAPVRNWDYGKFGAKDMPGKKTGLAGYLAHDFRFIETPNAVKKLTESNLIFCKKTKWKPLKATRENLRKIGIKNEFSIPARAEKTLRRLKVQVQKNSIVATALMLTISPEVLRDGDKSNDVNDKVLEKYIQGSLEFLRKKFGNRLLIACLHMDELNPHISAYVLPLVKKKMIATGRAKKGEENKERGIRIETRLGHTEMFTRDKLSYEKEPGTEIEILKEVIPGTCSILQDEYADALKEMGLDVIRGVRAEPGMRRLKYVTAKRQYERMMRGVEKADEAIARYKKMKPEEQEEMIRQIIALATEAGGYRTQRDYYQVSAAKKDEKIEKLEKEVENAMRALPVAEVIETITGIQPVEHKPGEDSDPAPGSKKVRKLDIDIEFQLPGGQRIGVDTAQNSFQNLTPEIPFLGEGAKRTTASDSINAVMYLTGDTYHSAMARLSIRFGNESAHKAAAKRIDLELDEKKKKLLFPDESRWPELLAKLKAMEIRDEVISQAKTEKSIAANSEGHILFAKQSWGGGDAERKPGMVVVDPSFPTIQITETGEDDVFMLLDHGFGMDGVALNRLEKDSIICATQLDALAIKSHPDYRSANVLAVGRNPGESAKEAVRFLAKQSPGRLLFAESLLAHGKMIADWLAEHFSRVIRTIPLPANCRSWIEAHIAPKSGGASGKEMPITPPKDKTQQDDPTLQ